MGWSSSGYRDKASFVASLTDPARYSQGTRPIKTQLIGNSLWTLAQTADGVRRIYLDLLEYWPQSNEWASKGISEDMGPCYYDCPLSFLKAATPSTSPYAIKWRQKVLASHAAKKSATASQVKLSSQVAV